MKSEFASYLRLKNIFSFSLLNYGQAALSFLVTLLLAKNLSKDDFGYYTYGLVFMNIVMVLSFFGTDKTLVRDLVQSNEDQEVLMKTTTIFKLFVGFIVVGGVVIWLLVQEHQHTKYFVALTMSGVGLLGAIRAKEWYDYRGRIIEHAWITLAEKATLIIGVGFILFVYGRSNTLAYVLLTYLIIRLISVVYEWWRLDFDFTQILVLFSKFKSKIIENNTWIWLAAIGNLLMSQANQLMLEGSNGVKQLASYGLAFQIIQLIKILQGQILRLATPQIANLTIGHSRHEIIKGLWKMSFLSLGCTIALVIPFYIAIPSVINLILGPEYIDIVPIFNILLVWTIIYGVALINNQFLVSLHLQKSYFVTTLLFGLISIFLAQYFIGLYAGLGAALSLLISHGASIAVQMAIVLWFIRRYEKVT